MLYTFILNRNHPLEFLYQFRQPFFHTIHSSCLPCFIETMCKVCRFAPKYQVIKYISYLKIKTIERCMYFSSKVISKTHDFIANYVISAPLSPLYSNKHYAQRTDGVFVLSYGCKILLKSFYKQLLKNLISCVNSIVDNHSGRTTSTSTGTKIFWACAPEIN